MTADHREPGFPILAAVALLSASALAYEILLTRLFAIVQWHHFAFMVISIALLGIGASGTFLWVLGDRIRVSIGPFLALAALSFAVAAPACFAAAERVPFNVLELPWSLRPFGWLFVIELLGAIPFFLAATGIGRTLVVFGDRIPWVYAADLVGAGAGAIAAVALLAWLPPERTLEGIGGLAALAAALAAIRASGRTRWSLLSLATVALVALVLDPGRGELRISPFKPLPQALRVSGAVPAAAQSGPLGLVSAVENEVVPFRWAPGLSLLAQAPVPEQAALFVDADGPIVIPRADGTPPAYLDEVTSALPYHLLHQPRALVLGAGGGASVMQALVGGARAVDAVELQPHVAAIARDRYREYSGGVFEHPSVSLHVGDPRAFVEAARGDAYDLIQVDALDASPSGLHALKEERLLTSESLRAMLARLAPHGLIAITGWSQLPPRGGVRLMATLLHALEEEGLSRRPNASPGSEAGIRPRSWLAGLRSRDPRSSRCGILHAPELSISSTYREWRREKPTGST